MFTLEPVAFVRNSRHEVEDDHWGNVLSEVVLADGFAAESLAGLEAFSHAELVFVFDRVEPAKIVSEARHPRNNTAWPKVGIFAQRGKNRPNRLGLSTVRIVSLAGRVLTVLDLDAIDGTPVLDIKPVLRDFLPQGEVTEPSWATELMRNYW